MNLEKMQNKSFLFLFNFELAFIISLILLALNANVIF